MAETFRIAADTVRGIRRFPDPVEVSWGPIREDQALLTG